MITRKQKRSILYILFVFILCSAAKDFEFLVLKTDETFLAENIFCKVFAILVISQCLVERKLSWRSIGFRLKGIKKRAYSRIFLRAQYLCDILSSRIPHTVFHGKITTAFLLYFQLRSFRSNSHRHLPFRTSHLYPWKCDQCDGGGRTFPRIDLQAGPEGFFHPERQLHSGSALWYLAPCYRCRMVQRRQPHAGGRLPHGHRLYHTGRNSRF